MDRKKPAPITLLHTSNPSDEVGYRVDLVPEKNGFTFRVYAEDIDDDDGGPCLTAEEWGRIAIQLLVKCPDARNPIGLSSAVADGLAVKGTTVGKRSAWKAWLTDAGSDYNGRMLLEWSSSRPLALYELGAAFKAMIARISEIAASEE